MNLLADLLARIAPILVGMALAACKPSGLEQDVAPAPSQDRPEEGSPTLRVYVGRDGVTTIGGDRLLDDASISARILAFHSAYPHGHVALECHSATLHGRAVRILDILREAHIEAIAVNGAAPTPSGE